MIISCGTCGASNRVPAARLHQNARCAGCKSALLPLDRPIDVLSAKEFEELVHDCPLPVVVDYWASWCAPCRMIAPELKKVASQKVGKVVVAKVNTEQLHDVARKHNIDGIPTMIVFEAGRERTRTSGARPASGIISALGL